MGDTRLLVNVEARREVLASGSCESSGAVANQVAIELDMDHVICSSSKLSSTSGRL
jgi:hypothetical protein